MQKMKISLLTVALAAFPAFSALVAGTAAPDFDARASLAGEEFDYSLSSALEGGPVVVYFYPSAYTRGCNIQAREFAVNGNLPTLYSMPASLSCSSFLPTQATSG